jgi:hypothetical protein
MGQFPIIMMIRYPHIDEHGFMESRTGILDDDDDKVMISWIRDTIQDFLDDEELEFEGYEAFLKTYYPMEDHSNNNNNNNENNEGGDSDNDNDNDNNMGPPPPFRVSYFDMDIMKWKYLEDEFIREILRHWHHPQNIDMNNNNNNNNNNN